MLRSAWTAPAPEETGEFRHSAWTAAASAFLWPLALLLVMHRVFAVALPGTVTDDFTTVWSAARRFVLREPVYNELYHHVDPHYLYNPGATLLLSPLGFVENMDAVRALFIIVNAACIIGALAWLTRLAGGSLSSPVFPGAVALAFLTEAVTNTLGFSNINGILFLGLTAFLAWFLAERQGLSWAAGIVLGLCILIKPMFAPVLLLPLLRLDWRAVAGGLAVPVVFNAVAWPLTPGARDYIDIVAPYLRQTRDYANSSLAGAAAYFGMPGWLHALLFIFFAAAVLAAVVFLARFRYSAPWVWAATTAAVLLAGVCLLSSLGQAYYSMMLFPAVFTLGSRLSVFRSPAAWAGIILCLSPLSWVVEGHWVLGRWMDTFLPTAGWGIFILAAAAWAVAVSTPITVLNRTERTHHDAGKHELQRLD